jgi:hypothetical protein
MGPALPIGVSLRHELNVSLVHEGGCLQGMTPPLVPQMASGQPMQFLVDDGNQFAGSFLITACKLL